MRAAHAIGSRTVHPPQEASKTSAGVVDDAAEALQLLLCEGHQILEDSKRKGDNNKKLQRCKRAPAPVPLEVGMKKWGGKGEIDGWPMSAQDSGEALARKVGRPPGMAKGAGGGGTGGAWREFALARDLVRQLGLQDQRAWRDWCRKGVAEARRASCRDLLPGHPLVRFPDR
jgi:hypothetical protein